MGTSRDDERKGNALPADDASKHSLPKFGGGGQKQFQRKFVGCNVRNSFYRAENWITAKGFSDSVSSDGLTEAQENEIAENIFDWWMSGKSYKKWYAEKFLQKDMFDNEDLKQIK